MALSFVKPVVAAAEMAEAQYVTAKTAVWWDIENCEVPKGVDAHGIAQSISSALSKMNYCGPVSISAFGDTNRIPPTIQQALNSTGIALNHVPAGAKDASDKKILVNMFCWALDNPAPANLMLISGDRDFSDALHQLRLRRYNVLLAQPPKASVPLVHAAKTVWLWTSLSVGGTPLSRTESLQLIANGNSRTNGRASGACFRCGSMDHKVRDCTGEAPRGKNQGDISGERVCYKCGEGGHMSSNCSQLTQMVHQSGNQGDISGERVSYDCGEAGHIKSNCPQPTQMVHQSGNQGDISGEKVCYKCGEAGHIKSNCSQLTQMVHQSGNQGDISGKKVCYNCGEAGHIKSNCPQPTQMVHLSGNQGDISVEKVCYKCGEVGHIKSNCPQGKRPSKGLPPPPKRQAVMPRLYSVAEEFVFSSCSRPITESDYSLDGGRDAESDYSLDGGRDV